MNYVRILCVALLTTGLAHNTTKSMGGSATGEPRTSHLANAIGNRVAVYNRNGVTIYKYGDGTEVGIDNSGHGAVLCIWSLYVGLAAYLDACFPEKDKEFRQQLGNSIDTINQFIIANSLTVVSKAELEARMGQERARFDAMPSSQVRAICSASQSDTRYGIYASFRSALTSEKLKASISDLLSVPRLPVMNPCL